MVDVPLFKEVDDFRHVGGEGQSQLLADLHAVLVVERQDRVPAKRRVDVLVQLAAAQRVLVDRDDVYYSCCTRLQRRVYQLILADA